MNNLVILFSGASHSGKTTLIRSLKEDLKDKVICFFEEIRKEKIINIDNIRKNPYKYFEYEKKIIKKKMKQEFNCIKKYNNKIILFDRSLIDSLFYYIFYIDKSKFSKNILKNYNNFLEEILNKIKIHIKEIYNIIFLIEPITKIIRKDNFTMKNLKYTQYNEWEIIKTLTLGFYYNINPNNLKIINSSNNNYNIIKNIIKGYNL